MKLKLLTGFYCAMLFCSCNNSNSSGFKKTASGFEYKIISSATPGDSIKRRDVVKVQLEQYADDTLIGSTIGKMPQYVEINSELREFDYTELLSQMRVNDSAVCFFEVKDIMKRAGKDAKVPKLLENRKQVKVYFRILNKFSSEAEAMFDQEKTQNSLVGYTGMDEKVGLSNAARSFDSLIKSLPAAPAKLEGGVYVSIMEKGSGAKVKTGQEVAVIYKGMLANGKVFEEKTREDPFVIHAGTGEAARGFDIAVSNLSIGDKARVYVPAPLAYGAQKVGDYIPAFSNLVFDMEIADLNSKNKQQ
jgi:FKBP-type peptidyl-prolyl cis-trans isomerase FkpA